MSTPRAGTISTIVPTPNNREISCSFGEYWDSSDYDSGLQNTLRILLFGLYTGLHFVGDVFIDDKLAIFGNGDLKSIQRTGCRAFEVKSALVVTASVARTFKFVFCREPVGRAAQVRTLGK